MARGSIAVVILAAGGSQRMGRPKQVLPFRGLTLLRHAVETAIASGCQPVVVTIGAYEDLVRPELHSLPLVIAHNPNWTEGIGSSLRVAVETLTRIADVDVEGVVITLADQPFVTADDIGTLVKVHEHTGKDIVASEYAGTRGVPMFLSRRLFAELATLNATEGAKRLIADHLEQLAAVPLPHAAFDIDTPSDWEKLNT